MLQQNLRLRPVLIGVVAALYALFYTRALLDPSSGLDYGELAAAQWLKIIPLVSTFAWLYLTRKLLEILGASSLAAWAICGVTAASPTVLYLATHHRREPLCALFATAALLALLKARPVIAGVLAALACAVQTACISVLIAGILTLIARRRLRDALLFTAASIALIAPAIGWKLAHGGSAFNILTHLHASEKATVLGANLVSILEAPALLVSQTQTLYGALVFLVLFLWAIAKRRQLVPDIFVFAYAFTLLVRIWPPERNIALVFPLILWMLWRGFRTMRAEVLTAAVILLVGLETVTTARQPLPDWSLMHKLFDAVSHNTPANAVIASNLDEALAFNTGHTVIPGFKRDLFQLFYQPNIPSVTPDVLSNAIIESRATFVAITPDFSRPEARSFRHSVEALERGGVLQPVAVPELPPGYRLLSYVPILGTLPARNY